MKYYIRKCLRLTLSARIPIYSEPTALCKLEGDKLYYFNFEFFSWNRLCGTKVNPYSDDTFEEISKEKVRGIITMIEIVR